MIIAAMKRWPVRGFRMRQLRLQDCCDDANQLRACARA
jgi:hypothetical protein